MKDKQQKGFAVMNPALQREIASQGGKAAHAKGVAHTWGQEEARRAGSKGGKVSKKSRASQKVYNDAYRLAREAGLDSDTADAVARRVSERLVAEVVKGLLTIAQEEIQKHANP